MIADAFVYDLEIKKAILQRGETKIEGIEYCEGWHDTVNMGISVLTAYSQLTERYHVFMDDNSEDFREFQDQHTYHVGFANLKFDAPVVKANWGIELFPENALDLQMLFNQISTGNMRGVKLDTLAQANLGEAKTNHGSMAPILWQRGQVGQVIDYCMNDTHLTRLLFEKCLRGESLKHPVTGQSVFLQLPD